MLSFAKWNVTISSMTEALSKILLIAKTLSFCSEKDKQKDKIKVPSNTAIYKQQLPFFFILHIKNYISDYFLPVSDF